MIFSDTQVILTRYPGASRNWITSTQGARQSP